MTPRPGPRPQPRRSGLAAAVLALAAAVAGCGSDATGADARLTIYVSAPLSGPARAEGQALADGAREALADAGGEAGGVEVTAEYLDVAGRNESRSDPVTPFGCSRRVAPAEATSGAGSLGSTTTCTPRSRL